MDGIEASLGTANFGPSPGRTSVAVTAVAHLRAHIKSRTRRGPEPREKSLNAMNNG